MSESSDRAVARLRAAGAVRLAAVVAWFADQESAVWAVSGAGRPLELTLHPQWAPFLVQAADAVDVEVVSGSRFSAALVDPSGARLQVNAGLWSARDASLAMAEVLLQWDGLLRGDADGVQDSVELLVSEVPECLRGEGSLAGAVTVFNEAWARRTLHSPPLSEQLLGDVLAALRPGEFGSVPVVSPVAETFVGLVGWPLPWPRVMDLAHGTTEGDLRALLHGVHLLESARLLTADSSRTVRVAAPRETAGGVAVEA